MGKRVADMTPEEREHKREYMRAYMAANPLTPEKRERKNALQRERRRANPAADRERNLRQKYGLTDYDYALLWQSQDGRCAICREPLPNNSHAAIDHDHETGRVRGLLHRNCNAGIGMLRDDVALLRAAIAYLENPPAYDVLSQVDAGQLSIEDVPS